MLGVLKMLGGALLAYLAISHAVPPDRAVDPNQMYLAAYEYVFPHYGWAVAATALFVVVSQLKINVTNAYAGSLAWSNFFSRLTHSHPGRVVWVVFNTLIAFMLMEMNVFQALGDVLGLYSNIAIAWMMAVVADLVINKPLGLSPQGHRVQARPSVRHQPGGRGRHGAGLRAVGHGAPGAVWPDGAGVFGPDRAGHGLDHLAADCLGHARASTTWRAQAASRAAGRSECGRPDAALAPAALRDLRARLRRPRHGALPGLPGRRSARCAARWMPAVATCANRTPAWPPVVGDACAGCCRERSLAVSGQRAGLLSAADAGHRAAAGQLCSACSTTRSCARSRWPRLTVQVVQAPHDALRSGFLKAYMALLLIAGLVAWWVVLAHKSRQVAQEESNRQTHLLMREIESAPPDRRRAASCQAWPSRRAGRAGQPGQEPLHQRHQPRAAHAAQQHSGLCAADGRGHRHSGAPQAGRDRDQARRRASAVADRRHAGHGAHRERASSRSTPSRCTLPTSCRTWPTCLSCEAAAQGPCALSLRCRASCPPWCGPTKNGCARS